MLTTIEANDLFRRKHPSYRLSLGITQNGVNVTRQAIGISLMLNAGLGNTIRVALPKPVHEPIIAKKILCSFGLRFTHKIESYILFLCTV